MKIIDFIFAARPMLLLPTWSIYLLTSKLIRDQNHFDYSSSLILIGVTLISVGAYFINQIYDYESDKLNNKLGFLQRGLITQSEMKAAYIATSILPLTVGFYVNYKSALVMVLMVVLGYLYSAPPARLKDHPWSGLFSNAFAYGILVPLSVPLYLFSIDNYRIHTIVCFFSMVAAGYLLTIIPDREGDRTSGKQTLAARWSDRPIIIFAIIFLVIALYTSYVLSNIFLICISALSIVLFVTALITPQNRVILFACKFPILLLSLLAGYYFPTYLVFLLVLLILTRIYYKKRFGLTYPRLS